MRDLVAALRDLRPSEDLILGADAAADIQVEAEGVAPRHVRLVRRDEGLYAQDLNTGEGTFVNGVEVHGLHQLRGGDELRLGGARIRLDPELVFTDGSGAPPRRPSGGPGLAVTLVGATKAFPVRDGFRRHDRTILDRISVHIEPGEFIGLLGASGSGKSTLIKAIGGVIELSGGSVGLGGEMLTAEQLRRDGRIAYMPQDVIVHEHLTPRRALAYAARLKGIAGTARERERMIVRALERVGLGDRTRVPIHRLSGGQRKRVALASELLGNPQVILLDEATSGLDPASEADMMRLFRSLADEGRTVVCITHFPGRLEMCDRLLYLIDGRAVFFGAPAELRQLFDVEKIEDAYRRQEERPAAQWREEFLATPSHRDAFAVPPLRRPARDTGATPAAVTPSAFGQLAVLLTRYMDVQARDWPSLLLMLAQAPIIALMVSLVFGNVQAPFAEQHAASTKEVIFVVVIAVFWCAGTLSVREIVKEQAVFQHETRFGVRALPYVGSKLALLGTMSIVQAIALFAIVRGLTGLTGDLTAQVLTVALASVVGVLLGLLVSAVSSTSERAMTLLPVVLIAQAIFSGGLARLDGAVLWLSKALIPAFWALDGMRSSFASALTFATYPGAPGTFQPPILGLGGPLGLDLAALGLQGITLFGVIWAWLRRPSGGALA